MSVPEGASSGMAHADTLQALRATCAAGNAAAMELFLSNGAYANISRGDVTPLLECLPGLPNVAEGPGSCMAAACARNVAGTGHVETCTASRLEAVQLLLRYGADPCLPCASGVTPILAAAACSTQLFEVLLDAAGAAGSRVQDQVQQPQESDDSSSGVKLTLHPMTEDTHTSSSSSGGGGDLGPASWRMTVQVACMRGCPHVMQLLLDRGLLPDLQEALQWALKVSCCACSYNNETVPGLATSNEVVCVQTIEKWAPGAIPQQPGVQRGLRHLCVLFSGLASWRSGCKHHDAGDPTHAHALTMLIH
jgi:hypothetical protein